MAIKVIHIEGGLGNQMACYAVYVATKYSNPYDDIYVDTYIYDIDEAGEIVSMWNGYELEKIFGVHIPNIKRLFSDKQIKEQIDFLKKSKFWENNWNYDDVFIEMMNHYGYKFQKAYGNVGENTEEKNSPQAIIRKACRKFGAGTAKTRFGYEMKKIIHTIYRKFSGDCGLYLLENRNGEFFYNITLDFMKSPKLHQLIGEEVRKGLLFKEPTDEANIEYLKFIRLCNSVSIHIRRSDYLQYNEDCYKYGYFNKCVKFIKSKVEDPVFFVFSDDLSWCKKNRVQLGLTEKDKVYFVDVNSGADSYKDMQLMSNCKHNIATKSSFGWWASFLNQNKNKITCCQKGEYVCTNQF